MSKKYVYLFSEGNAKMASCSAARVPTSPR